MKKRSIPRYIIARGTLAFAWLLERLPLPVAKTVALGLGRVAYLVVPKLRRTGLSNLDLVYGDSLTRRQKALRVKRAVDNVSIVAAEFSRIKRLHGPFGQERLVVDGLDRLPADRGAIIIGAHMANWEWIAPALASRGVKMAEIVRPVADPTLNEFIDQTRRSGGIHTIPKQNAAEEAVRLLGAGCSVGIMVDQSPHENGVPLRFMDRECWGTIGPVIIALRSGSPIHPLSIKRMSDGRYHVEVLPQVELVEGKISDTIVENCQRCQDHVDRIVRDNPDQWLWLHRRWKPQPRLEREWRQRQARNH